ncbi:MAG: EamA family transporter [Opitutaceae bacterium]
MLPTLLSTLLFALTAVFATQAAVMLGGVRANLGRLLVAVVLLAIWAHVWGNGWGGGQFGRFFLAGAIGFGLGGLCMFQAFPRIGSTLSLLVVECAAAVSTAGLSWWYLGASLTPLQMVFGLVSIGGVLVGLAPFRLPDLPRRTLIAGAAFAVVASVGQGISWTLSKSAFLRIEAAGDTLEPLSAAYQRLLGGVTVALVAAVLAWAVRVGRRGLPDEGPTGAAPGSWSARAGSWVVANALAGPVFGVGCLLWAIREVGNPGIVQAVVATATLVSVPMARRLEVRRLRANYFLGAGLSILGTAGLILLGR